jgi:hypothetical protein
MRFIFSALVSLILMSSQALAATVNAISGQVLLNRGEGYRMIAGPTEASPGTTVVANPGGNGQIVYPDGCIEEVVPGTVVTVAADSPCKAGAVPRDHWFVIGALIVGGGVGAAFLLKEKDKPASP